MNDFERRLTESLRARAEDVEPTPELYTRVEDKMNRNQRWTVVLSGVGLAAVVAIAAVAVPNLLDDGPESPIVGPGDPTPTDQPTDQPTDEPTDEPTGDPGDGITVADHVVLTADDRIWLAEITSGDEVAELVDFSSLENESEIVAVEVRPGSTVDDLTVVYLLQGEGSFTLGYVTYDGSDSTNAYFPDEYQPSADLVGDALPVPAFDPTGSHLAWIEPLRGEENLAPNLRTIGWSDGPGTDGDATDNASFTLDAIPIEHSGRFVIEDWVWTDQADGSRSGYLTVTGGAIEAWNVAIEEQGDGALALSGDPVTLLTHPDGAIIDRGNAEDGGVYVLVARGSDSQDAEDPNFVLQRLGETASDDDLPVPDFIQTTAAPPDVWMTVYGDGYAIGLGGQTAVFLPGGQYQFDASYADFVR